MRRVVSFVSGCAILELASPKMESRSLFIELLLVRCESALLGLLRVFSTDFGVRKAKPI